MKFEQIATLIGVVGKKGQGQLDNGQHWETDRVELHVITPFPESDVSAFGSTVTVYSIPDHDKHFVRAQASIQQEVVLSMDMQPAKKLGAAPKFVCTDFRLSRDPKTLNPKAPV